MNFVIICNLLIQFCANLLVETIMAIVVNYRLGKVLAIHAVVRCRSSSLVRHVIAIKRCLLWVEI